MLIYYLFWRDLQRTLTLVDRSQREHLASKNTVPATSKGSRDHRLKMAVRQWCFCICQC